MGSEMCIRDRGNPLAPMCAYDTRVIAVQPEAIVSVHPLRRRPKDARSAFSLYWGPTGRVLDGEIDAFSVPVLRELLAVLLPTGEPIDLDVRGLDFLNGGGAFTISQASTAESPIRLTGAQPIVQRVWKALDLDPAICLPAVDR